jgi:hypothetical protein
MFELDPENLEPTPPIEDEQSLANVADWGPTEDWADWLATGED